MSEAKLVNVVLVDEEGADPYVLKVYGDALLAGQHAKSHIEKLYQERIADGEAADTLMIARCAGRVQGWQLNRVGAGMIGVEMIACAYVVSAELA